MDDDKEAVGGGVWKSGEAEMVRGGLFLFSNTEGRQERKSLERQHFRRFSAYEVVDIDQQNIDLGPTKVSNDLEQFCLSRTA